jgi:hypothetical protein
VSCDSSAVAWSPIRLVLVFMVGARRCRSSILLYILLYSTWKRKVDVPTRRFRQMAEGLDGGPARPAGNAMATPPHTAKSLDVLPISAKFTDRRARSLIRHVKGLCAYVEEGSARILLQLCNYGWNMLPCMAKC